MNLKLMIFKILNLFFLVEMMFMIIAKVLKNKKKWKKYVHSGKCLHAANITIDNILVIWSKYSDRWK